jgi:hypothetical protein
MFATGGTQGVARIVGTLLLLALAYAKPCRYAVSTLAAQTRLIDPVLLLQMEYLETHCKKNNEWDEARICPCVDDPDGFVADDPLRDCKDVDMYDSAAEWGCPHFDGDFNGHAVHIWQLCPKSCGKCANNPCGAHYKRGVTLDCDEGEEEQRDRKELAKLKNMCDERSAAKSVTKLAYNRCPQLCEMGMQSLATGDDLMKEDCYYHNGKLCSCAFPISTKKQLAHRFVATLFVLFFMVAVFGGALAYTCSKAAIQCKPENTAQQETQFFGRFPMTVLIVSVVMVLTCWGIVFAAPFGLVPACFGIAVSTIQLCCAPRNQRPLTAPLEAPCCGCKMWVEYLYKLYIAIAIVAIVFGVLPGMLFFVGIFHSMAQCGYGGETI